MIFDFNFFSLKFWVKLIKKGLKNKKINKKYIN